MLSGTTVRYFTKHGQTKDDIFCALERSIYDETLETDPNKTLSIGYDMNASDPSGKKLELTTV